MHKAKCFCKKQITKNKKYTYIYMVVYITASKRRPSLKPSKILFIERVYRMDDLSKMSYKLLCYKSFQPIRYFSTKRQTCMRTYSCMCFLIHIHIHTRTHRNRHVCMCCVWLAGTVAVAVAVSNCSHVWKMLLELLSVFEIIKTHFLWYLLTHTHTFLCMYVCTFICRFTFKTENWIDANN